MAQAEASNEATQAGILVWGSVAARAVKSIAPLVILYLMGESDVGAFAALMLVYQTIVVMLSAGFPRAVLYFLADRTPRARRLIVSRLTRITFVLGAFAGVLFVLLGVFGPGLVEQLGRWAVESLGRETDTSGGVADTLRYLPLLALFALFDVPSRLLPNILLAEARPRASAGVGVVQSLGMACATLVPAALGWGVPGIAIATAGFGVAYGVMFLLVLRSLYRGLGEPPSESGIPGSAELIRYCLPLGLTDIVTTLNTGLDLWLITLLFPLESVAHYKAGAWQIPVITTIAYSVGAVYLPRFASLHRSGKPREAIRIWRESARKVALIVVPLTLVFIVGAEELVGMVYPEGYGPSAGVFRAYCFLTLARVTAFGSLILAAGRPKLVLYAASLSLLANALISVPLVLAFGFLGPAVGTALAFIPTVALYCTFIARAWRVPLSFTFPLWGYLRVLLVAAPAIAGALAIKLLLPWGIGLAFACEAVVILGGYALVGTVVGLIKPEDWRFAANWARMRVLR